MARRFIREDNRRIVDVAEREVSTASDLHQITELIEISLLHSLVIDDQSII